MPTTDARRAEVEKLREKAAIAWDRLYKALDDDRHDEDCVLRCFERDCEQMHSCGVCREDGEV